jgi:hypothetical protein
MALGANGNRHLVAGKEIIDDIRGLAEQHVEERGIQSGFPIPNNPEGASIVGLEMVGGHPLANKLDDLCGKVLWPKDEGLYSPKTAKDREYLLILFLAKGAVDLVQFFTVFKPGTHPVIGNGEGYEPPVADMAVIDASALLTKNKPEGLDHTTVYGFNGGFMWPKYKDGPGAVLEVNNAMFRSLGHSGLKLEPVFKRNNSGIFIPAEREIDGGEYTTFCIRTAKSDTDEKSVSNRFLMDVSEKLFSEHIYLLPMPQILGEVAELATIDDTVQVPAPKKLEITRVAS